MAPEINLWNYANLRTTFDHHMLCLLEQAGNICHVDCSGRGTCDYTTGQCSCYDGFYSENCGKTTAMAYDALSQLTAEL